MLFRALSSSDEDPRRGPRWHPSIEPDEGRRPFKSHRFALAGIPSRQARPEHNEQGNRTMKIFMRAGLASGKGKGAARNVELVDE